LQELHRQQLSAVQLQNSLGVNSLNSLGVGMNPFAMLMGAAASCNTRLEPGSASNQNLVPEVGTSSDGKSLFTLLKILNIYRIPCNINPGVSVFLTFEISIFSVKIIYNLAELIEKIINFCD